MLCCWLLRAWAALDWRGQGSLGLRLRWALGVGQDVERLGEAGARIDVKRGFLRNWLLPQKKATQLSFAEAKALAAQVWCACKASALKHHKDSSLALQQAPPRRSSRSNDMLCRVWANVV